MYYTILYMLCIYMYIYVYLYICVCTHIHFCCSRFDSSLFIAHSSVDSHEGLGGDGVLTPGEPCDGVHWFASVYAGQPCIIAGLEFVAHIAVVHLGCGMRMILIVTCVMMQMALCDD